MQMTKQKRNKKSLKKINWVILGQHWFETLFKNPVDLAITNGGWVGLD